MNSLAGIFTILVLISGSLTFNNFTIDEISNDTSLTDSSQTAFVTEHAAKTYLDTEVSDSGDLQTYLRILVSN